MPESDESSECQNLINQEIRAQPAFDMIEEDIQIVQNLDNAQELDEDEIMMMKAQAYKDSQCAGNKDSEHESSNSESDPEEEEEVQA